MFRKYTVFIKSNIIQNSVLQISCNEVTKEVMFSKTFKNRYQSSS